MRSLGYVEKQNLAISPSILVVQNGTGVKTVQELVSLAKAQPGALTFASGGSGTGRRMAAELLKPAAGIDIRHIPYKGGNNAIPDLLGGRVTMIFLPTATALPLARDGKVRAIADVVEAVTRSAGAAHDQRVGLSGLRVHELVRGARSREDRRGDRAQGARRHHGRARVTGRTHETHAPRPGFNSAARVYIRERRERCDE
jgi:hypothetical protein